MEISVLAPHRHPRLRYALRAVGRLLGWRFVLTTDEARFAGAAAGCRLRLGSRPGEAVAARLPLHPFLAGKSPTPADLTVVRRNALPLFFPVPDTNDHDLLACIFYVLSRYEEYDAPEDTYDEHGRFPARASHAHRNGYLQQPVIRYWVLRIADHIRETYPDVLPPTPPPYRLQLTYDIDILWAYRHRGWRGYAAGLRDLLTGHFARVRDRFLADPSSDPYGTVPWLETLHGSLTPPRHLRAAAQKTDQPNTERGHPPVAPAAVTYFWLLANGEDRRDPNPFPVPKAQAELMSELTRKHACGLHPSYRTSDEPALLREEVARYTDLLGQPPRHARQHFLRFRLPATYRQLNAAGITHEHSMGYADAIGWRAGTNHPFRWYDLGEERETGLTVHPFAAMDVTLKKYLELSPEAAASALLALNEPVAALGGDFALLWHNSSFAPAYGWVGWQRMYERLLPQLAAPYDQEAGDQELSAR